ncbi:DUF861 domain-containing protein [Cyanobium sp. BA20m-p-22]|nr:DUF861 domain-containing protein [Cyanobium sp. BA20m-p-22]
MGFHHHRNNPHRTGCCNLRPTLRGKPQSQHPHGLWGPESEQARCWPIWGCEISTFHWAYDEQETCLLLEGDVSVTPDG